MSPNKVAVEAKEPGPVLTRELEADFKGLFTSLSKAIASVVSQNWTEAGLAAADAASKIGFKSEPEELAWLLVRRALIHAMYELIGEHAQTLAGKAPEEHKELVEKLHFTMDNVNVTLERSFFDHPGELPIVKYIQTLIGHWLEGYGLEKAQAKSIADRLPEYFVYALHDEWVRSRAKYEPLAKAFNSPFLTAAERERAWARYAAYLQKQVCKSIFKETFSLRHVYVNLRAYYEEKKRDGREVFDALQPGERDIVRVVVDLEKELNEWLKRANKDDAIRVISGGPGSGKSSFAKMFAADQSKNPAFRTIYIPLHLYDCSGDLASSLHQFVTNTGYLFHNPLDANEGDTRLLIIFDGLDELSKMGKVGADIARQFVKEVRQIVGQRNSGELRVQVLISGRTLAVQAQASEFRMPKQVLHILPYHIPIGKRGRYIDPGKLLAEDQRNIWWRNYCTTVGLPRDGLPQELKRDDLEEITSEPLLNYLFALSYNRGKIDFTKAVNLNEIYEDLLQAVYERGYEGHPHIGVKDIEYSNFARILEEIGLAAWHGDGRTTSVSEIREYCSRGGLLRYLEAFQQGAESGITEMLTAFYFRQSGTRREGDQTFEFTHKSFGEYLTALRIFLALRNIQKQLERHREDPDDGWGEREALTHWTQICGLTTMDEYLFNFVLRQVELEQKETVNVWQGILCTLISFLLKHGMPIDEIDPRPKYREGLRQARNAEEALLALLSACATATKRVSEIAWPEPTSAGEWICRLRGQRGSEENVLSLRCLSFMKFEGQALFVIDLYGANLQYSKFNGCDLPCAFLAEANLRGADLREANLTGADFREADLQGADLTGADISEADFEGANLLGVVGLPDGFKRE